MPFPFRTVTAQAFADTRTPCLIDNSQGSLYSITIMLVTEFCYFLRHLRSRNPKFVMTSLE